MNSYLANAPTVDFMFDGGHQMLSHYNEPEMDHFDGYSPRYQYSIHDIGSPSHLKHTYSMDFNSIIDSDHERLDYSNQLFNSEPELDLSTNSISYYQTYVQRKEFVYDNYVLNVYENGLEFNGGQSSAFGSNQSVPQDQFYYRNLNGYNGYEFQPVSSDKFECDSLVPSIQTIKELNPTEQFNYTHIDDFYSEIENFRFDLMEAANPLNHEKGILVTDIPSDTIIKTEISDNEIVERKVPPLKINMKRFKKKRSKEEGQSSILVKKQIVKNKCTSVNKSATHVTNDVLAKIQHKKFLEKIWILASDINFKPIEWTTNGTCIRINLELLKPCLDQITRSKKFSSFLRQLHLHRFRKTDNFNQKKSNLNHNIHIYRCKDFHRDKYEELVHVKRH